MYTQEITRRHRAAIVIAIDQSSSMSERIGLRGCPLSKAEMVSIVTGQLIDELILRSHRDSGYRHYYDIAVVGYSGEDVTPLLGEELVFYPITMLAGRSVPKVPYNQIHSIVNGGIWQLNEDVSMWISPAACGATPMYKMITCVTELVEEWCAKEENRESFPPLVFNITDGEASDADYDMLRNAASRLKKTGTEDGNTLFINVHISSDVNHAQLLFPNIREIPLSVRHAHLLMDMSSEMPKSLHSYICGCRPNFAEPPYIAMSYNALIADLVTMLNIGTRSVVLGL